MKDKRAFDLVSPLCNIDDACAFASKTRDTFIEFTVEYGFDIGWGRSKYRWEKREKIAAEDVRIERGRWRGLVMYWTSSIDAVGAIYMRRR